MADVDGDGLRDLVVGDFGGKFRFYRNIGARGNPKFAASENLMAGDAIAEVRIYCCIGSSPCFADFDGDGQLDLLSGSYDPGECYWFRGLGKGHFGERQTLVDVSGKPILRKPDQKASWESFGSFPALVDWDHDGDADLLVGGFDGTAFLHLNEGTSTHPALAAQKVVVHAAGEPLQLPKTRHAAIVVADWDTDGVWDILSGSDSGAVFWYRNTGKLGRPEFAEASILVPAHQGGRGYEELREIDQEPYPGIRTQIAVADYNDDGKLDLLTGDFCTVLTLKRNMAADDRAELGKVREQLKEANEALNGFVDVLRNEFIKRFPGDAIGSKEANDEFSKRYQELRESLKYKDLEAKAKEASDSLSKFLEKPTIPDSINPLASCHGYVWLYLRK